MLNRLNSIINGYPDGTFKPLNNIKRAEAMSIISNYVKYMSTIVSTNPVTKPIAKPEPTAAPMPTPTPKPEITEPGIKGYDVTGTFGEKVGYLVYANAFTDLGKFSFKITFDPEKLVAMDVYKGTIKNGDFIKKSDIDLSRAQEGIIFVKSDDTSQLNTTSGLLFTVVFGILGEDSEAAAVKLSGIQSVKPEMYKTNGDLISHLRVDNGVVNINQY